jgi:hypothetical protein
MKPLTPRQAIDHIEFACYSTFLIIGGFIMGWLIGAFVSDREVCDE